MRADGCLRVGDVIRAEALNVPHPELVFLLLERGVEPYAQLTTWSCLLLYSDHAEMRAGQVVKPSENYLSQCGTLLSEEEDPNI